jgi:hypothetical protein
LYAGLIAPPVDVKDIHVGMVFWMSLLSFPSSLLVFFGLEFGTAAFGSYYFSVAWDHHRSAPPCSKERRPELR